MPDWELEWMELPRMAVPVAFDSTLIPSHPVLKAITFPPAGPPIVLLAAWAVTAIPPSWLGTPAVPAAFVPM